MLHDSALLALLALTILFGSCEKTGLLRRKNASLHGAHTRILSLTFPVLCTMRHPTKEPALLIESCSEYPSENTGLTSTALGTVLALSCKDPGPPPKDKTIPFAQLRTCFLLEKSGAMAGFLWIPRGRILFIQLQMAVSVPFQFTERRKHEGLADLTFCRQLLIY